MSYPDDIGHTYTDSDGNTPLAAFHPEHHDFLPAEVAALKNKLGTGASIPALGQWMAGTGAGASGWRDKPSVDVRDYPGVDPTGADESTDGIEAAYADARGRTVEFPTQSDGSPAVYVVTRKIAVPDFTHHRGAMPTNAGNPMSKIKLANATNESLMWLHKRSKGVSFELLDLDGNKANNSGTSHVIEFEEGDGLLGSDKHILPFHTIVNCTVHDGVLDNVNVGKSHATVQIVGSTINKAGRDNVRLRGDTSWIDHCVLAEAGRYGLLAEGPVGHVNNTDIFTNDIGVMVDLQDGDGPWGYMHSGGTIAGNAKGGMVIGEAAHFASINGVSFNANGSLAPFPALQASLASSDIINSTAHGRSIGDAIWLRNLVGGAGLASSQTYYVIAANFGPNQFQVSLTPGGVAIDFTTDIVSGLVSLVPAYAQLRIEATGGTAVSGCTFFDDSHPAGGYAALYDIQLATNAWVNGLNIHAGHYVTDITNTRSALRGRVGGRTFVDGLGDFSGHSTTLSQYSADGIGGFLTFQKSRNATFGGHTVLNLADQMGGILAQASDGVQFRNSAMIDFANNAVPGAPGVADTGGAIRLWTALDNTSTLLERLRADNAGQVHPGADNTQKLGTASNRWSEVFAGTGTINTSDEREKDWRGGLSAAEMRVAKRLAKSVGVYRMQDAVKAKGKSKARLHAGLSAQVVADAFAAEGLDATKYGMFCHDSWEERVEPTFEIVPALCPYGDDEKCQRSDVAEWKVNDRGIRFLDLPPECPRHDLNQIRVVEGDPRVFPAGDLYGIRYDELAAFVIAGQEARLAALEAK